MYRVIEYFTDLHDDDHEYREGDVSHARESRYRKSVWKSLLRIKTCVEPR